MTARKRKAQDVPAKDGDLFLTYVGEAESVDYMGVPLPRGVAVPVSADIAGRLQANPFFEVSRGNAG